MPYFISETHPDCESFAVVKEDGSLHACAMDKDAAIDMMVAVSLAEGLEPGGTFEGDSLRAALPGDKFTTKEEALERAEQLGCEGTHEMDENGQTIFMPCSTHGRYEELTGTTEPANMGGAYRKHEPGHDVESKPAPKADQIEGSDKNEPGSASDASGGIELSERVETALKNKVKEHNDKMAENNRPNHTRATLGMLKAVYRRGAGAYSGSHRPGVSRAAWSMARVNAFLHLLDKGKPKNAAYITDNDLLPKDHPKSTRSLDGQDGYSLREVNLDPPAYMRAAARRGLAFFEDGLAGDGVTEQTVREARAMVQGTVTADKWVRTAAWIARHMVDLDAPAANPESDDFPSPGVVAHLLWGSGPSKAAAKRTMEYAEGVVKRLEAENEGRASGEAVAKIETRTNPANFEVRDDGQGGMSFEGYAAVFDSPSEPLPFVERISQGAFRGSLKQRNDIKLLWNHDTGMILGSTRSGSLSLTEDSRGLKVSAQLPNTTAGRDAAELLRRGDVDAMSFGFSVPRDGDAWNADGTERTLKSIRLHEVSIVAFPAYTATAGTTSVRGLDKICQRAGVDDADALADALLKIESGDTITIEEKSMLTKVIDTLAPEANTDDGFDGEAWLALKKKKLQLLKAEK